MVISTSLPERRGERRCRGGEHGRNRVRQAGIPPSSGKRPAVSKGFLASKAGSDCRKLSPIRGFPLQSPPASDRFFIEVGSSMSPAQRREAGEVCGSRRAPRSFGAERSKNSGPRRAGSLSYSKTPPSGGRELLV